MATGLYFGTDERLKTMLDAFFEERLKSAGESHAIVKVGDEKKFAEALAGLNFDVIFVEMSVTPTPPNDWVQMIHKTKPSLKSPFVLVGGETDPTKIYKHIESGWRDYVHLPPDRSLVIEKFWMHAVGGRSADVRQVYSLALKESATLAKVGIIEELSEFDCKIHLNYSIQKDDLMILYSKAFASVDEGETEGNVLARCYRVDPAPSAPDEFVAQFYFVGAGDERLKAIRSALRRSYVSGKR